MWKGENGINKQIGEQGYEESLVPILHLKSVLNGNRPRPTALKDNMHRLGRVGRFTPNPALPTDQPLRGSSHNKCFLFPHHVLYRILMLCIQSVLSKIGWVKSGYQSSNRYVEVNIMVSPCIFVWLQMYGIPCRTHLFIYAFGNSSTL